MNKQINLSRVVGGCGGLVGVVRRGRHVMDRSWVHRMVSRRSSGGGVRWSSYVGDVRMGGFDDKGGGGLTKLPKLSIVTKARSPAFSFSTWIHSSLIRSSSSIGSSNHISFNRDDDGRNVRNVSIRHFGSRGGRGGNFGKEYERLLILGSGIAGCSTALTAARHGVRVTILHAGGYYDNDRIDHGNLGNLSNHGNLNGSSIASGVIGGSVGKAKDKHVEGMGRDDCNSYWAQGGVIYRNYHLREQQQSGESGELRMSDKSAKSGKLGKLVDTPRSLVNDIRIASGYTLPLKREGDLDEGYYTRDKWLNDVGNGSNESNERALNGSGSSGTTKTCVNGINGIHGVNGINTSSTINTRSTSINNAIHAIHGIHNKSNPNNPTRNNDIITEEKKCSKNISWSEDAAWKLSIEGPMRIRQLLLGKRDGGRGEEVGCVVDFDRDKGDELSLCLEASHSAPRIIHHADCTGRAITTTITKACADHPLIEFVSDAIVTDLIVDDGVSGANVGANVGAHDALVIGARVLNKRSNTLSNYYATHGVVLASGGLAGIYEHSTNPAGFNALGSSVGLALRLEEMLGYNTYSSYNDYTDYNNAYNRYNAYNNDFNRYNDYKHYDDGTNGFNGLNGYRNDVGLNGHDRFNSHKVNKALSIGGMNRAGGSNVRRGGRSGGGIVSDLEYVQFHPTSLYIPHQPRFLLTEALRGEGAILRDADGRAFAKEYHPMGELAPRDVVARAVFTETQKKTADETAHNAYGEHNAYLDITHRDASYLQRRFPSIHAHLTSMQNSMDFTREWIPIVPAAHYTCGGVRTDLYGRVIGGSNGGGYGGNHGGTNGGDRVYRNLYAAGEAARTGLHGGNRLASTSLLEGLVFGSSVGEMAAGVIGGMGAVGATGASNDYDPLVDQYHHHHHHHHHHNAEEGRELVVESIDRARHAIERRLDVDRQYSTLRSKASSSTSFSSSSMLYTSSLSPSREATVLLTHLKSLMWDNVGVVRTPSKLEYAVSELSAIREEADGLYRKWLEGADGGVRSGGGGDGYGYGGGGGWEIVALRDAAHAGLAVAEAALANRISGGAHYVVEDVTVVELEEQEAEEEMDGLSDARHLEEGEESSSDSSDDEDAFVASVASAAAGR